MENCLKKIEKYEENLEKIQAEMDWQKEETEDLTEFKQDTLQEI